MGKEKNDFVVYKHTSPSNKVYIGMTGQPVEERWNDGRGYLGKTKDGKYNQPAFAHVILKYGWENIKHEILFEGMTEDEACQKEIEMISFYKSNDPEYGYNLANGGKYAGKQSEATKEKISKTLTGRKLYEKTRESISKGHIEYYKTHEHYMKGKHLSEETRNKISTSLTGRTGISRSGDKNPMYGKKQTEESNYKNMMSQPNKKRVAKINKDTLELIDIYESYNQAAKLNNCYHSNIARACKEKHRIVAGFKWRLYDEHIKEKDAE